MWIPTFKDNQIFLKLTDTQVSTPLERELWNRLAEETGYPDSKASDLQKEFQGYSREDLCIIIKDFEEKIESFKKSIF